MQEHKTNNKGKYFKYKEPVCWTATVVLTGGDVLLPALLLSLKHVGQHGT